VLETEEPSTLTGLDAIAPEVAASIIELHSVWAGSPAEPGSRKTINENSNVIAIETIRVRANHRFFIAGASEYPAVLVISLNFVNP
jgi:hypothetical protein